MSLVEIRQLSTKVALLETMIGKIMEENAKLQKELQDFKTVFQEQLVKHALDVSAMCHGQVSQHLDTYEHGLRQSLQGDIVSIVQKYQCLQGG